MGYMIYIYITPGIYIYMTMYIYIYMHIQWDIDIQRDIQFDVFYGRYNEILGYF